MAREGQSERGRMRYGMCLNSDGEKKCSKAVAKEIQQISSRKEMVCAECGKPLRECPPPKQGPNKGLIIGIIAAVVLLGGGVGAYFYLNGDDKPKTVEPIKVEQPADSVKSEPAAPEKEPEKEPEEKPVKPAGVQLSFGTYSGGHKGGYPDGTGTVTFTRQHTFKTSSGDLTVYPGETMTGTFRDGMLNHGELTQKNGNPVMVKGIRIK